MKRVIQVYNDIEGQKSKEARGRGGGGHEIIKKESCVFN